MAYKNVVQQQIKWKDFVCKWKKDKKCIFIDFCFIAQDFLS